MTSRMTDQRFTRAMRLRSRDDFRRVYDRRATASDDRLLVYACANDLGHPRLGLSVSRKVATPWCVTASSGCCAKHFG